MREDSSPFEPEFNDIPIPSLNTVPRSMRFTNLHDLTFSEERLFSLGTLHYSLNDDELDHAPLTIDEVGTIDVRRASDGIHSIIIVNAPIAHQEHDPAPYSESHIVLTEKYGKLEEVLGKGTFATVRLCCPLNSQKKFAVKEFRKKKKEETKKEYVKKLIAEFCISSSLDHENVVKTLDLIQDSKKQWCVVMEYCGGGNLYTRIAKRETSNAEIYCYSVQLIRGVKCIISLT